MSIYQQFEKIGDIFIARYLEPYRRRYTRRLSDSSEALKFFLGGEIFARQGASPDYSPAAIDAVHKVAQEKKIGRLLDPRKAWKTFKKILNDISQKYNPMVNPLAPQGTDYYLKVKKTRR